MNRTTVRRLLTTTVAVPVALTALLATAPGALASPPVAGFVGDARTQCDLPVEPFTGQPTSGEYDCWHEADSTVCASVIRVGPAVVRWETCSMKLRDAWTAGHADWITNGPYVCRNGFGAGRLEWTPESGGPTRSIGAFLAVDGGVIRIEGSYIDADTHEVVVIRASITHRCSPSEVTPGGFTGTVFLV